MPMTLTKETRLGHIASTLGTQHFDPSQSMLEFKWRILDQVELERVIKLEKEMKAILEEENRQNLEKVVEYMTTHYPAPYSGPFGSGPPSPPPIHLCNDVFIVVKLTL
jgi:hypothetical protein